MKKLYLNVALFVAFASGAQAQDSMVGMNMDGMDMKEAPSAPAAHAEGTVKAIDALGGKVTLAHGPVPALKWPAMTMGFKASRSSSNN
jgi:Cu(I)/Ag(I) efflux system protein CusF